MSQHVPNIFPRLSQDFPNIFPRLSQDFPNIFPRISQDLPIPCVPPRSFPRDLATAGDVDEVAVGGSAVSGGGGTGVESHWAG